MQGRGFWRSSILPSRRKQFPVLCPWLALSSWCFVTLHGPWILIEKCCEGPNTRRIVQVPPKDSTLPVELRRVMLKNTAFATSSTSKGKAPSHFPQISIDSYTPNSSLSWSIWGLEFMTNNFELYRQIGVSPWFSLRVMTHLEKCFIATQANIVKAGFKISIRFDCVGSDAPWPPGWSQGPTFFGRALIGRIELDFF